MFLGIDVGTSAVKAVILSEGGEIVETATAPLRVSRPHPLWSQQDPDDWWTATQSAVAGLSAVLRAKVIAIGLSGQMHGATLLDAEDRPLRQAILWNDGRSTAECEDLQSRHPEFVSRGGNLVMPGFTAPKIEWVRRHEPSVFEAVKKVLLPKDYVRLCMTGEYASDMSDSAGTLWLDVAARDWCDPLLDACGLDRSHMPALYEGPEITGHLRADVASDWGLAKVAVCAGGGDNAAGAVGVGVIAPGDALVSLGTSGVIFAATDTYRSNPGSAVHAFCHALPDRWHVMSVMLSAASCLDWAARLTNCQDVAQLISLAEATDLTSRPPVFLPYLSGERTPHNNAHAMGALFGLTHETGPGDIGRAVMEGVAFGLADGLDAIRAAGVSPGALNVIGGGSRSSFWGSILASALNVHLIYRSGADVGPALGAARLAAVSQNLAADIVLHPPDISFEVAPDPRLTDTYQVGRQRFRDLYTSTLPSLEGTPNA
ncbi:MAG: xylulokinase [Pseudomonadota bacterium]